MNNAVLGRWRQVLSGSHGTAVTGPSGEVLRTWDDIEAEARHLSEKLSGEPGAVGLQTGNIPEFPALLLGCWRAGRPVCLFDADLPAAARDEIGRELGATTRVVVREGNLCFENTGARPARPHGRDLFKLTSGTTARPRAIGFSAPQLLADCDQICETMGLRTDDVHFGVIPFSHSYGFSNLVTPLLCRGIRLVVAPDALPRAIEKSLASSGATVLPAVPALFRGLLSADSLPPGLRLCISAGAPLEPSIVREFHARFGLKIHSFYGASECGGICYDASEDPLVEAGFVGHPLTGVQVEVSGGPPPFRIRIRSRAVGSGAGIEAGAFSPDDLLVRDGHGFRIVGRESDLINVAGKKVAPAEIERALAQCPGVRRALACAVDDAVRGQEICALIEGNGDPVALRRQCRELLPAWKVPRRFAFASEIPAGPRGKASRKDIAKMFFGAR
ncbi:MAG: class I adenylate-forming enzyme family protein [Verrucomicrobiae bacterium]